MNSDMITTPLLLWKVASCTHDHHSCVTHQLAEEGGKCVSGCAQTDVLVEQHRDELLGLRGRLVATRQLLEQAHLHLYHKFPTLRLQALEQLVRVFYHKSITKQRQIV